MLAIRSLKYFFNFFVAYIHELWEMKWKIQYIHIHDGKIGYKNKITLISESINYLIN